MAGLGIAHRCRRRAGDVWRAVTNLLCRAAIVVMSLTVVTVATTQLSQARSDENYLTQVSATPFTPDVSNGPVAVVSSAVKLAIGGPGYSFNGSDYCCGLGCAGTCGSACSAAIIGDQTVTWEFALRFDVPRSQGPPFSTELTAQFRPPKSNL
jgi:hypothetical protein